MSDLVKLRSDWHAETLANGRTIAPGEPFPRADLADEDDRLTADGLLIDAHVTPAPLEGDDLQERAKALNIKGRTSKTADELREAVALAEAEQGRATAPAEPQKIGAGS